MLFYTHTDPNREHHPGQMADVLCARPTVLRRGPDGWNAMA